MKLLLKILLIASLLFVIPTHFIAEILKGIWRGLRIGYERNALEIKSLVQELKV